MDRKQELEVEKEIEQRIARLYWHIDHREFEKAVEVYTEDAELIAMGIQMRGRTEILEALKPALGKGTIRHVVTNLVIDVINYQNAKCNFYTTVYYNQDTEFETMDSAIPFEGPNRTHDIQDDWLCTKEGWRITRRTGATIFNREIGKPTRLEDWAKSANK